MKGSSLCETFRPLWQSQPVPQEFTAELEPLEVVFVELCGSGKVGSGTVRQASSKPLSGSTAIVA